MREREHARTRGVGVVGEGGGRIRSRLYIDSKKPDVGLELTHRESMS